MSGRGLWISVHRGGSIISGYRECIDFLGGILCVKSRFDAPQKIIFRFFFVEKGVRSHPTTHPRSDGHGWILCAFLIK